MEHGSGVAPESVRCLAPPLLGPRSTATRKGHADEVRDIIALFSAAAKSRPEAVAVTSEPLEDPDEEAEEEAGRREAGVQSPGAPIAAGAAESRKPDRSRKMKFRRERYMLTYADLEIKVWALAAELQIRAAAFKDSENGAVPFVAICLERTVALAVAVLGVLAAGAAYVPLEPSHPGPRLRFLLEDSAAQLLITCWCARRRSLLPENRCIRLAAVTGDLLRAPPTGDGSDCMAGGTTQAEASHPVTTRHYSAWDSSLAYLLYTSGSTGAPKGVVVPRRGVVNQLDAFDDMIRKPRNEVGNTCDDLMVALATICFDIAALELLWPLCFGFRVLIANGTTRRSPPRLASILEAERPSILQATPVTWRGLVHAGWRGHENLAGISGGEAFPPTLVRPLLARCGAGLWNVYGPTETTLWCTAHKVQLGDAGVNSVPIGQPLANYFVCVAVPEGEQEEAEACEHEHVEGELLIGGAGVTLGYHRRPELTARRFLPWSPALLPHESGSTANGSDTDWLRRQPIVYRSGDLVRPGELADGDRQLTFRGRLDFQVKFRGFRIELGEIEAVLERHPDVQSAACVLRSSSIMPSSRNVPNGVAVVPIEGANSTQLDTASTEAGPLPEAQEDRLMLVAFVQFSAVTFDGEQADADMEERQADDAADVGGATSAALKAAVWAEASAKRSQQQSHLLLQKDAGGGQGDTHTNGKGAARPSSSGLRAFLAAQLPAYMVPRRVVTLPQLPVNPNGKVDRQALKGFPLSGEDAADEQATAPNEDNDRSSAPIIQPAQVAAIVAEVTGMAAHERQGDDEQSELAALGIDSMTAVPLAEAISKRLLHGLEFPVEELFAHTSIDSLCSLLTTRLDEQNRGDVRGSAAAVVAAAPSKFS